MSEPSPGTPGAHEHERRYGSPAERLRAPERVSLMEVPRVVDLSLEAFHGTTVLDVGTGTAVFAEAFAGRGLRVTGIDPNEELLSVARTFVPDGQFQVGTAEELPFEDGSFDLLVMAHVLHETDDPLLALREAFRVARLRVIVLEWPYRDEDRGPPLAHRLPAARIEELARRAGFAGIEKIDLTRMVLYRLTSKAPM